MSTQRGATEIYICLCCKQPFVARVADRKRGWARFCSKSCKARRQEARTGQYAAHLAGRERDGAHDDDDPSWDAHKHDF